MERVGRIGNVFVLITVLVWEDTTFLRRMWCNQVSGDDREGESVGQSSDCVLVSVTHLISPVDFVYGLVSFSVSEFVFGVPQLSVSGKRSTSIAMEREQHKKAKAMMEVTPVQPMFVERHLLKEHNTRETDFRTTT